MQYSLPSACLRWGANTVPCNQVLAGALAWQKAWPTELQTLTNSEPGALFASSPWELSPRPRKSCLSAQLPSFAPNSGTTTLCWGQFPPIMGLLESEEQKAEDLKNSFCIIESQKKKTGPLL